MPTRPFRRPKALAAGEGDEGVRAPALDSARLDGVAAGRVDPAAGEDEASMGRVCPVGQAIRGDADSALQTDPAAPLARAGAILTDRVGPMAPAIREDAGLTAPVVSMAGEIREGAAHRVPVGSAGPAG